MPLDRHRRAPLLRHRQQPAPRALHLAAEQLESRFMLTQTTGLFLHDPQAADGYVLFSPNTSTTTYLIDKDGAVVNQWHSAYGPGLLGYLQPDGSLIRDGSPHGQGGNGSINAAGAGGLLERFDWNGNKTWEFAYDSPTHLAHHDFEIMPNGDILLIAWELKSETEATAAGRDPNLPGAGYLYPDSIVEVHPDYVGGGGSIVWEWHIWDHLVQQFDATKSNYYGATGVHDHPELINLNYVSSSSEGGGQAEDWTHANGIDYNPQLDQIVLSSREFSEYWIIDHSTTTAQAASHSGGNSGHGGDVLFRYGNPQTYDRGTAADRVFYYQHDPKWIPAGSPGAGDITVFNNGVGRPGQDFSQVVEITPPVDGSGHYALAPGAAYGPVTATWTYNAPVSDFSAIISSAQRLPNGDTLIDYGVKGTFSEVTAAGQEVWRYVSPYANNGVIGPTTPVPSLGLPPPLLDSLYVNFAFQAIHYPVDYLTASNVTNVALFYNQSSWDGGADTVTTSDDSAIATDKTAYIAGSGSASSTALSTFTRGINGVMVDLLGPAAHTSINASDFIFKTGNDNTPSGWATAPAPILITVRTDAGVSSSDRVEILWGANAVKKAWLEVEVLNTAHTGLAATDVFYWGNMVGDSNLNFSTTGADASNVLAHIGGDGSISGPLDHNRGKSISGADASVALANIGSLTRINLSAGSMGPVGGAGGIEAGPAASPAGGGIAAKPSIFVSAVIGDDAGIASALVATASSSRADPRPAVPSVAYSLRDAVVESRRVAAYFNQLAEEASSKPRVSAACLHDVVDIDDDVLDSLVAGLKPTHD